ncbi:DUF3253 domain-containing protein [Paracoccus tibetensis]|uniref:DUF3253 domain-containing protein n=1 Tax=Paracoccus tibetensis TaxID=336292 RepID=UPI001FE12C47|nr:DUF3253 domain-containing protein [Paracoccus tibetensis]
MAGLSEADLRAAILAQAARLRPGTTCCPSEIARALSVDWRPLMAPLRAEAFALAADGRLVVTQRGRVVGPDAAGPIRLGRPEAEAP